jgi:hypothetical protein
LIGIFSARSLGVDEDLINLVPSKVKRVTRIWNRPGKCQGLSRRRLHGMIHMYAWVVLISFRLEGLYFLYIGMTDSYVSARRMPLSC